MLSAPASVSPRSKHDRQVDEQNRPYHRAGFHTPAGSWCLGGLESVATSGGPKAGQAGRPGHQVANEEAGGTCLGIQAAHCAPPAFQALIPRWSHLCIKDVAKENSVCNLFEWALLVTYTKAQVTPSPWWGGKGVVGHTAGLVLL